jgi:hypothetical protein
VTRFRLLATITALSAVALVAACSSSSNTAASAPSLPPTSSSATAVADSPSPTGPAVNVPHNFTTPRALVAMLNKLGAPCTGYHNVDRTGATMGPPGLLLLGNCTGAGGADTVVGIFNSHTNAEGNFEYQTTMLAGIGTPVQMAIGGNWTLVSDDGDYARQAAELLGGEYREATP